MGERYLIDSDVAISYLRGHERTIGYLESLEGTLHVSAITVAELYSGVRDNEREALDRFLSAFDVVAVDGETARRGGLCRRDYQPSHGVGLADAIIAMSAESLGATLVTFKTRRYPMVGTLQSPA